MPSYPWEALCALVPRMSPGDQAQLGLQGLCGLRAMPCADHNRGYAGQGDPWVKRLWPASCSLLCVITKGQWL